MNPQHQVIGALFTSLIVTGAFVTPVLSQAEDSNSLTEISQNQALGTASDLLIPARGSVQHDTFGDVHEGVTQFRGFFPLFQTPGSDLLFFNGGFNVDNSGNFGGSAILGYRKYLEEMNRIFGGYLGWDNRETDKSSFNQIVMGVETLGDWDFRLNGFIPVGTTRNQILNIDTGLTANNIRFQDHYLLFDTNQEIRKIYESAVTGFDLEVGTKITDLGETGALRAYAGPYYYSADGGSDSLGFRLRLSANPTDYLTLGLGFQTDGIFGENLLFSIGANFPSTRAKTFQNEPDSVLARLGDNVFRNSTILVDRQEESQIIATVDNKATNPATGQPWFFNHVDLGNGNSNGTWESPYGTLAEGILGNGGGPAIPTDGNGVVYVRGTADILEFPTIPGNVQILSAGPIQNLLVGNMPGFTQVELPESGANGYRMEFN
jgi:trimeric autotransporter adhesin